MQEEFPPPPMVSLTPPQPQLGGIPQVPVVDPFGIPSSPEARAEHFMASDPNYADARGTMNKWKAHQEKRAKLESDIEGLASQYGIDPNDPAASLGSMVEHAAGNFGAHGGLITRMLTLHDRQVAARQDEQRKTAATGMAVLKFMRDAVDKGDENMLSAVGRYAALGGDAKDLMKEYASQDHKGEVDARLTKKEEDLQAYRAAEQARKDAYLKIRQTLAPHQIAAMDEIFLGHGLDNQKKQAELPYAAPLAAATLAEKKQAPALKMYNAISGRIGASGQQPIVPPPPTMLPAPSAVAPVPAQINPGPVMQLPNGTVVPAQNTPRFDDAAKLHAKQAEATDQTISSKRSAEAIVLNNLRKRMDTVMRRTGMSEDEIKQRMPEFRALDKQAPASATTLTPAQRAALIQQLSSRK